MTRNTRRGALTIAWGLLLSGCSGGEDADRVADDSSAIASADPASITLTEAQLRHGGVRWESAVTSEVATTMELPGQLVPNEDRTARIGAPAEGRIVTVHVRAGQGVSAGQALVTMQSQAASAALADVAKASAAVSSQRAAATYARTAKERVERLLAIKAASRQEMERAAANDELAQSELAQAEAELARARAVSRQLGASAESGAMVLRAPIAGVVLSRDAAPGAVVMAGAPLMTIADVRTLWLEIAASDRAASSLRRGGLVRFTVPAFAADTFNARVQSVGGALDSETRTVPVLALVENSNGRLRPAMFATTWTEGATRRPAMLLPDSAVQLLDNRHVVFVAHPDGKGGARLERRDVEVGATVGGRTQVFGGLRADDLVVVAGAFSVKSEFAREKMAEG
ncbi:MAG: efflux RND transporter periplasmic adaptor subunit [Gemmatimonadaceae bacterium]